MRADVGRIFSDPHARISWNNCGMRVWRWRPRRGTRCKMVTRNSPCRFGESSHPRHARRWPTISPVVSRSSFHGYRDACTCSGTNLGCRRLGIRRSIARCICTPMALSLRGNSVPAGRKLSGRQESTSRGHRGSRRVCRNWAGFRTRSGLRGVAGVGQFGRCDPCNADWRRRYLYFHHSNRKTGVVSAKPLSRHSPRGSKRAASSSHKERTSSDTTMLPPSAPLHNRCAS